ncbi:zinc finger CCHC domain-containing protein 8 [Antechinus flavipes]|uniref:zinc finger CCHC domain-containing protein 8 n=1 Tax=Antechinus flavipes TaxID=38775 RepID=UPI0022367A7F|nr:zinc finger CCHC domain-containing protein 8 [Antechinus flavipes]
MAAEVDFGDRELFEAFGGDDEAPRGPVHIRFKTEEGTEEMAGDEGEEDEPQQAEAATNGFEDEELRERLRRYEDTIEQLRAENQELKRKLSVLSRPSGILVNNSKLDGPLLQILFMNNVISKQYHQEIEEFVSNLVKRYEEQKKVDIERTAFNVLPQPSSIVLEEDRKVKKSKAVKKIKEAFSVVGSVLYFTNFCLDKLGQPLLNENPQLTEGWEIPKYQQVFSQIVSLEGQEIQVKAKRPKAHCFNCGSEEHQMKDCPMPRNAARINEKRKEFMEACGEANNQNYQQRYHAEEVEERFGRFKPGIISEELQDALGVTDKTLPPFIYRMRQLGYPPGWLKEAELENSGLALYDGKDAADGETEAGELQNKCVTYDLSKLVNYPGFNISTPKGISDDWRIFGSIPMQASQQKDVFASYLSSNFQATSPQSGSKRAASQSSPCSPKKQRRGSSTTTSSATDMDLDSDMEIPHGSHLGEGFQFQPPLPPGSPLIRTPPPLPQGTPPCTPPSFTPPLPRGTPPPTPGDPAQPRSGAPSMDEDTLTLEELEEQQRLIWAALEQADSANSDSDLPGDTPLTGNSVSSSPCQNEPETSSTEGKVPDGQTSAELGAADSCAQVCDPGDSKPGPDAETGVLSEEVQKEAPTQADSEDGLDNGPAALDCEGSSGRDAPQGGISSAASSKTSSPIPDMSKFAAGITPFEFENMAESTGVYLRIRSLLKNSPRNQQKNKKT